MSDKHKPDRRIERTQTALWEALFALLHEETWGEVNVSKICQRANVARSSFYLHFQNKQELLDHGFTIGMRDARAVIFGSPPDPNHYTTLYWLADHIYAGRKFLNFKLAEDTYIFTRFQKLVRTLFVEELRLRGEIINEHELSFVMGGVFSILLEWVVAGYPDSPESMAARINELTRKII